MGIEFSTTAFMVHAKSQEHLEDSFASLAEDEIRIVEEIMRSVDSDGVLHATEVDFDAHKAGISYGYNNASAQPYTLDTPRMKEKLKAMLVKTVQKEEETRGLGGISGFIVRFQLLSKVPALAEVFAEIQQEQGLFILNSTVTKPYYQHTSNLSIVRKEGRVTRLQLNAGCFILEQILDGTKTDPVDRIGSHAENMQRYEGSTTWINGLKPRDHAYLEADMERVCAIANRPEAKVAPAQQQQAQP